MLRIRTGIGWLAGVALLGVWATALRGDDDPSRMIRDSFETAGTVWEREQTDATINLLAHDRSKRAAHDGRLSEHFQFASGPGSSLFYSYKVPKVPATDDLRVSLFVRANRAGVRIYGRVILPADVDPETGQPSFVLVPGTIYDNIDRWQRLELIGMRPSIEGQARVIRATTRRPVRLEGAYLERVVVNLYCGVGEAEVFLDDLNVAPVPAETVAALAGRPAEAAEAETPKVEETPAASRPAAKVAIERPRLKRNGYDWLVTAIEAPGADIAALRKTGCDVLVDAINADPERSREAVRVGFLLQPNLSIDGEPLEPAQALAAAAAFPFRDAVAFWGLGEELGRSDEIQARAADLARVRAIKTGIRGLPRDYSHLTIGTVADNFGQYAKQPGNLDIVSVRPFCWASAQKPNDTYLYLKQRRELTIKGNPNGLFFAWLPAAPPPEFQLNVWGDDPPPAWGTPVVQPEQLRVYTYLALAAGYRGIGFQGNADLTRNDLGKMLLIEMALLNEEIDLFESILGQGKDPIPRYETFPSDPPALPPAGSLNVGQRVKKVKEYDANPFTKVAAIDTSDRKGSLLLVSEYMDWAAFQPNQMAMNDLKVTVPARESAQGWLVSPGGVVLLDREKTPNGTRFSLPDYGPTALVLVTTDLTLPERIRAEVERVRPLAVQLALEQARIQFTWVTEINGRLLADGHQLYDPTDPKIPRLPPGFPVPHDEADLLAKSDEMIKSAQEALEREEYELAWTEARRATRPLRILMFYHWLKAYNAMVKAAIPYPEDLPQRRISISRREREPVKPKKPPRPFIQPIACPPLGAFNLLPQAYIWIDWMSKSFSRNLVPSGTFDEYPTLASLESAGWTDVSRSVEGIASKIEIVKALDGKRRILKLSAQAADPKMLDVLPPFYDFPIAAIRSPEVKVKAGQFIRITVDISKKIYQVAGHGGVIIRDSIGGEPLQFRCSDVIIDLTPTVLFRRAPADGVVTVTLGLAGRCEAYFNDFKVEVAEGPAEGIPADLAGRSRPALPDPATPPRPDPATASRRSTATRPLPVPRTNR